MASKRVNFDRFITLSEEINVSFRTRNELELFLKNMIRLRNLRMLKLNFMIIVWKWH